MEPIFDNLMTYPPVTLNITAKRQPLIGRLLRRLSAVVDLLQALEDDADLHGAQLIVRQAQRCRSVFATIAIALAHRHDEEGAA